MQMAAQSMWSFGPKQAACVSPTLSHMSSGVVGVLLGGGAEEPLSPDCISLIWPAKLSQTCACYIVDADLRKPIGQHECVLAPRRLQRSPNLCEVQCRLVRLGLHPKCLSQ